jgi:hypothetical protein
MPEQRHIAVSYRRQVSDGNYGTEAAEVSFDWWVDQDNDSNVDEDLARDMLSTATDIALDRLRTSLSADVRRAVAVPRTITPTRAAPTTRVGDEELPF